MTLSERDQKAIWHPYTSLRAEPAIPVVRGKGSYLYAEDGTAYLDAVSSWWVTIHGHLHPAINKAIREQLTKVEHLMFAGFTHPPAVDLAEALLKILPGKQSRIFYSDNGSTAVEVAVKLTIQYWKNRGESRQRIMVMEHSYHGDTFGAMAVSERGAFTAAFAGMLFDVDVIPFPHSGREQQTIKFIEEHLGSHSSSVAAMIVEPLILGAGGMLMYDASTLEKMFSVCHQFEVPVIADEVMTGFGRTGKLFACDHIGTDPDIICISKGITGGYMPLGVTACSEKIVSAFDSADSDKTFYHGHSYTANPIACATSIASLELLKDAKTRKSIELICKSHQDFASKLKQFHCVTNVRVTGTVLAFDIDLGGPRSYFHSFRDEIYKFYLSRGIIARPLGNTIYFMPPYSFTKSHLNKFYKVTMAFLDNLTDKAGDRIT